MSQNFLESIFQTEKSVIFIAGLLLGLLGLSVMARNHIFANQEFRWWALFILIPAFLFFGLSAAFIHWGLHYRLSLIMLGLGLTVLAVASLFMLNLSWERWWPVMLITPTLTLFLLGLPDSTLAQKPEAAAWIGVLAWIGFSMVLLGFFFLAGNFGLVDLAGLTQRWGWWSLFILLCAVGAAFNAFWLWQQTNTLGLPLTGLACLTSVFFIASVFEAFRLPNIWELPVQSISSGILLAAHLLAAWRNG